MATNKGNDTKNNESIAPDPAKPATKIKIIEDAEATGETAAAYDFWRAGSGRHQVPGIIKCFGARPDFLRQVVQFSNTVHFSAGHLERRVQDLQPPPTDPAPGQRFQPDDHRRRRGNDR